MWCSDMSEFKLSPKVSITDTHEHHPIPLEYVYSVRALRWGDSETHSYMVGVFSTMEMALDASDYEEQHRGGKYECEIIEHPINVGIRGDIYND